MDFRHYLPPEMYEFLFGHGTIPAYAPMDDPYAHAARGKPWPSPGDYEVSAKDCRREPSAWHHGRIPQRPRANSHFWPARNAFEGSDDWDDAAFDHAYAGGTVAEFYPCEPRHMCHHENGRQQQQRSTWCPAPPQWPHPRHHQQWASQPGHAPADEHHHHQHWRWTNQVPFYTVEEPTTNFSANEQTHLPRRSRSMEPNGTHDEEQIPDDGEKWGPVGLGANVANEILQHGGIGWKPVDPSSLQEHSPPASPHPHVDPIHDPFSFLERGRDGTPRPGPTRYPPPDHIPYELDKQDYLRYPSSIRARANSTYQVDNNAQYLSKQLQHEKSLRRRGEETLKMYEEGMQQLARELELEKTKTREYEATIAKAGEMYVWSRRDASP